MVIVAFPDAASAFETDIESIVQSKRMPYMDAVLHWCHSKGFEEESGAELVRRCPKLRNKIQTEAAELHFLKKKKPRRKREE